MKKIKQIFNREQGASLVSVLVSLVILQALSLTVLVSITSMNKGSDISNKLVISSEMANSFLDLSENTINNTATSLSNTEMELIIETIRGKAEFFNEKNPRYDIEVTLLHNGSEFNTSTSSEKGDLSKSKPINEDYIEIFVAVSYDNPSKPKGTLKVDTFQRLVVLDK